MNSDDLPPVRCAVNPLRLGLLLLSFCHVQADDWPQWGGAKRDGIWRESGIVETIPDSGLKVRWRARVSNGYSGPAVANGRVFLTDRLTNPDRERVLCFNESDGTQIWEYSYPCEYADMEYGNGPRATPTVHAGLVYTFGTQGHLFCFAVADGRVLWQKDLAREYQAKIPRYGASAAPIVEKDLLIAYVGGKPDAMMVAFDRQTGVEQWRALSDRPAHSAPVIVQHGSSRQLIAWTGEAVNALSPATGKALWRIPYECSWDVAEAIATPVYRDDLLLLVKGWGRGSLMLKLNSGTPAVTELWRTRSKPSTMMASPVFISTAHFISIDGQSGLGLYDTKNGNRLWANRTAIGDARLGYAHATRNGDRIFAFNQSGHLILGRPTPDGFEKLGETLLIEPTRGYRAQSPVTWAHPAYANQSVYVRNDRELVCSSLAANDYRTQVVRTSDPGPEVQILSKFIGMNKARALTFSPDGNTLAVGTMIGTVRRVDAKSGATPPPPRRRGRQRNRSSSIAWSNDGRLLAIAGGTEFRQSSNNRQTSGYVRLWNAVDNSERPELPGLSNNVVSVVFSPDDRLLATGGADRLVRIWESESGRLRTTMKGHTDAVWSVAFAHEGRSIVSAGWDRTLRIWDVATGRQTAVMKGHDDEILSVAVSPDGRFAASGSADWTVRIWDLNRRKQIRKLSGHNGGVYSVSFAASGERLFTGSGDETVRIWNIRTGENISTLRGHKSGIRALALSPDNKQLATAGIDDALRIWQLD